MEKSEFNVGDWVVWKHDGYVGRIKNEFPQDYDYHFEGCFNIRLDGNSGDYTSCHYSNLRLALPHEIPNIELQYEIY